MRTLWLVCCAVVHAQLLALQPSAFSSDECTAIIRLFDTMERQDDERSNPLLPLMGGAFGVRRANRYADGSLREQTEAILARLLQSSSLVSQLEAQSPRGATRSAADLAGLVDFTLLHEFTPGGQFDWHVDTKPGDGTGRTLNINVMLSDPTAYSGGTLQVGDQQLTPQLGDAYLYYAGTPHRVGPLENGTRHTLVIALTERHSAAATTDEVSYAARRRDYWAAVEAGYKRLTANGLRHEPKVHILHGEHLEALDRGAEAREAFCKSYRATAAPLTYAAEFYASGVTALGMQGEADASGADSGGADRSSARPDLPLAESYLAMAACVDPSHPEASQALQVVREALSIRARANEQ